MAANVFSQNLTRFPCIRLVSALVLNSTAHPISNRSYLFSFLKWPEHFKSSTILPLYLQPLSHQSSSHVPTFSIIPAPIFSTVNMGISLWCNSLYKFPCSSFLNFSIKGNIQCLLKVVIKS